MEGYQNEKTAFINHILASEEYKAIVNRMDLYDKIKLVEGEGFISIEGTDVLSREEMIALIVQLRKDPYFKKESNVNILVNNKFPEEVDYYMKESDFQLLDETVTVYKGLEEENEWNAPFSFQSLNEASEEDFIRIWKQTMVDSRNAAALMSADKQLKSAEKELGSHYKDSCMIVYEGEKPIGIAMPHIEPGTRDEGRLFYLGLIPEERGKGKSKPLHNQALQLLKSDFDASFYIGFTSENNSPMLQTFAANGCIVIDRNKLYKLVNR